MVATKSGSGAGYLACACASVFWSLGFFFGKIAFRQLSVDHFVLYRFLFATLALLPALRRPNFTRKQWTLLSVAAVLGIPLQFLIQFYGLSLTTVSHAALMVGTMPVFLAVGATVFTHERLNARGWIALFASTLGVSLIVLSSGNKGGRSGSVMGDLLVMLSLAIALGWVLINKRVMASGLAPIAVSAWGILVGTVILCVWVLAKDGPPPVRGLHAYVWTAITGAGFLCTAATTVLWNWGIHRVPASRAGVLLNIEPALGCLLGVCFLGDHLGAGAVLGGIIVIVAVWVITRPDQRG